MLVSSSCPRMVPAISDRRPDAGAHPPGDGLVVLRPAERARGHRRRLGGRRVHARRADGERAASWWCSPTPAWRTAPLVAYMTAWSLFGLQRIIAWEAPLMGWRFVAVRVVPSLAFPVPRRLARQGLLPGVGRWRLPTCATSRAPGRSGRLRARDGARSRATSRSPRSSTACPRRRARASVALLFEHVDGFEHAGAGQRLRLRGADGGGPRGRAPGRARRARGQAARPRACPARSASACASSAR